MCFHIAIDGSSGTGKSTIAKLLAERLKFIYVDTGAMYRSIAYYCLENRVDIENELDVIKALDNIHIEIVYVDNAQRVMLNSFDISSYLRTQLIGEVASKNISVIKEVREKLVYMQQQIAKDKCVIMDGRDIGTKVLPNAQLKIYLDANIEAKTERRCNEYKLLNISYDEAEVMAEIIQRDERDSNRTLSPLIKADDAIYIDSSLLSIDEVLEEILKLINQCQQYLGKVRKPSFTQF